MIVTRASDEDPDAVTLFEFIIFSVARRLNR